MNTKIKTLSIAAALAASISLAGCAAGSGPTGASTDSVHSGHGSSPAAATSATSAAASAEFSAADVAFAQMMIPHRTQAVEMSDIILTKPGLPAEATALAGKIKAAQAPEIRTLAGWLDAWNQPAEPAGGHSGHGMSGMVDADGIDKLKAAQGTDAARLFLEQMVGHHEGAIDMAQQEIGAGKYPEAVQLARGIATAQEAEIAEMKELLAGL